MPSNPRPSDQPARQRMPGHTRHSECHMAPSIYEADPPHPACWGIHDPADAAEHAAIGGVVPGYVSAGMYKRLDCPVPNTLLPQEDANGSQTKAYVSHMSSHAQNAREIHRLGILRIPRTFNSHPRMSAEPYRHVSRRGIANGSGVTRLAAHRLRAQSSAC